MATEPERTRIMSRRCAGRSWTNKYDRRGVNTAARIDGA